jgi:predicted nucleotidyltransferase
MLVLFVGRESFMSRSQFYGGAEPKDGNLEAVRVQLAAEEAELRRRGVRHLAVFGSVARGNDQPDSDVDVAVEVEPGRSFSLIRMEETRQFL